MTAGHPLPDIQMTEDYLHQIRMILTGRSYADDPYYRPPYPDDRRVPPLDLPDDRRPPPPESQRPLQKTVTQMKSVLQGAVSR